MPQTLAQYFAANNCTYTEGSIPQNILDSVIFGGNDFRASFTPACGHPVVRHVISKLCEGLSCEDCELLESTGYNTLTQTLTCKKCGEVTESVPEKDLRKVMREHCFGRTPAEYKFYQAVRELLEKRSLKIENCVRFERDLYDIAISDEDGLRFLIEINEPRDAECYYACEFSYRDYSAAEHGVQLLRFYIPPSRKDLSIITHLFEEFLDRCETMNGVDDPFLFITDIKDFNFFSLKRFAGFLPRDAPFPSICQSGEVVFKSDWEVRAEPNPKVLEELDTRIEELIAYKQKRESKYSKEEDCMLLKTAQSVQLMKNFGIDVRDDAETIVNEATKFLVGRMKIQLREDQEFERKIQAELI